MENASLMRNTVRNNQMKMRENYFIDQNMFKPGVFSSSPTPKIKTIKNGSNIPNLETKDKIFFSEKRKIYLPSPFEFSSISPINSQNNRRFKSPLSLYTKDKSKFSCPYPFTETPTEGKHLSQKKTEVVHFPTSPAMKKNKYIKKKIQEELENIIRKPPPENINIAENEYDLYIRQLQQIQLKAHANTNAIDKIQYKLSILATLGD